MSAKHIHLIGVCGTAMASLAGMLRACGHRVTGSDLSIQAVARARMEAAARNLVIPLYTADMRDLSAVPGAPFDAVVIADNAFAHLPSEDDLRQAAAGAAGRLDRGGILLATMRDYDALVRERPTVQGPVFCDDGGRRRIVLQVWDWTGERRYTVHLYITRETDVGWECLHFTSNLHAVPRGMVTRALADAGVGLLRELGLPARSYETPARAAATTAAVTASRSSSLIT